MTSFPSSLTGDPPTQQTPSYVVLRLLASSLVSQFGASPRYTWQFSCPIPCAKQTMYRIRVDCLNPGSDTYCKNIGQSFNLSLSVPIAK